MGTRCSTTFPGLHLALGLIKTPITFLSSSCAIAHTFTPSGCLLLLLFVFSFILSEFGKKQKAVSVFLMLKLGEESAFVQKTLAGFV